MALLRGSGTPPTPRKSLEHTFRTTDIGAMGDTLKVLNNTYHCKNFLQTGNGNICTHTKKQ